jgi:hypothetical protein
MNKAEIDYAKPLREVFRDATATLIRAASRDSSARSGPDLRKLDYTKSKQAVFVDAIGVLKHEAEETIRLRLIVAIVTLGGEMNIFLPQRKEEDDILLIMRDIKALWVEVHRYCVQIPTAFLLGYNDETVENHNLLEDTRFSVHHSGSVDEFREFLNLVSSLQYRYYYLANELKSLVDYCLIHDHPRLTDVVSVYSLYTS